MEEFWKDDFRPLQWAGKAILQSLRDDEDAADADLYKRLTYSQEGSHLYFRPDAASSSSFPGRNASLSSIMGGTTTTAAAAAAAAAAGSFGELLSSTSLSAPPATVGATHAAPPVVTGASLKHRQTLPLPTMLTEALKNVQTCSFMGLLMPVDMAWMTVDEKLFLFSADNPAQGTIQCFENPRKQPILAVALVKPKQGVFRDIVKWCLVVTTPEEVILLALARVSDSLKIIPTSFMMPTDLVRMQCAAGTDDGRIFLGGDDGCVHEMIYEDQTAADFSIGRNTVESELDEFYDGTKVLPDVVVVDSHGDPMPFGGISGAAVKLGKRTWQAVSSSSVESPRKAKKLNRTTQASSVVTALVPNVIRQASTVVFGAGPIAQHGGRIVRLAVDSERQTLYTLSEKGWISVMDISQSKNSPVVAVCDVPKTARLYLEAVSRGQMFPPRDSGSATVGNIQFPGGGAAAQAGVGGMEGARNILRQADWQRVGRQQTADRLSHAKQVPHPIVTPVALHVIPCQDSAKLTLMAVTGGGLRLFFSALSTSVLVSTSGTHISLSNGSRMRSLGTRLNLCHIRSPPPLNFSNPPGTGSSAVWSADVSGGILPRISVSSAARVDASYYKDGQWVVAMEDPSETVGSDILVAATPDTAIRPREGSDGKQIMEPTGGLSETITLPIDAAGLHGSGEGGGFRTLSGGLIWEIDSNYEGGENSAALQLLLHSPTPSNADLDIGLPPVYCPPSQARHSAAPGQQMVPFSGSRAIIPVGSNGRGQAFQVLRNVLVGTFTARPISYGISAHQRDNRQGGSQAVYRVSKRTGEYGFSLTAAEQKRTLATAEASVGKAKDPEGPKQAKSARLRQWLLQPPTKALNQWTKQHLLSGKKVITALNVLGIHKFEFGTVLSSLADALMTAGENVADDTGITSFFTSYGYKEGCAMCLALAVGCGPAEGSAGYNQNLRRLAIRAAMDRAYKPRLRREDLHMATAASGYALSATNATDNCVPVGYLFIPSALCEGLYSLVSRLARPIWHKPLVVVTEGRSIKEQWASETKITSVKVELLLENITLERIRMPLQSLVSVMRTIFSRAIDVVPGMSNRRQDSMENDGGSGQQYLTQALQYQSQFRSTRGDSMSPMPLRECDKIAHLLEERNIHSMYRIVSRVVQLLNLLKLLRESAGIAGLPQVDWGLLHGITVSQLVQLTEGHDRLETLLNELVVSTAAGVSQSPISAQADHLAGRLAQQCYLFFPPSSRFTYQGLRLASEALSHPPGSSHRKECGERAASQLMEAARHWQSASLISGRLVRGNGKENYYQIATRAIQYSSPLARAVDLLIRLEDVSSVVEICLTTSHNFKAHKMPSGLRGHMEYEGMLSWESNLYHKHSNTRILETQMAVDGSLQTASPETYGSTVTAIDAIDACYALVFYHLDGLLQSNQRLADHMVSACSAVNDESFLTSLFTFLLESSNVGTLLRIDSPEAESFLKKQSDPDLLWRYYTALEKFAEAGEIAYQRAHSEDSIPLDNRIEWLTKALNSYHSAQKRYRRPISGVAEEHLSKFVSETEDRLRIARLQSRVLRKIAAMTKLPDSISNEDYERLKTSLIQATPLYNDFVAKVPFYDLCLVIFHTCRYDDLPAIKFIWKSALCWEIFPCGTRNPDIFESLQKFAAEVDLSDRVTFLDETVGAGDFYVFEDGDWVKPLQDVVIRLGKEIYGTGADYTFPVDFIMEQLETLRKLAPGLTPGWPLLTLVEAGVPYLVVLEAYDAMNNALGTDVQSDFDYLTGSIELLATWVSNSQSAGQSVGQHSSAHIELSRSKQTGDLAPKLNALRFKLEQLQGVAAGSLNEQLNSIEKRISYLVQ